MAEEEEMMTRQAKAEAMVVVVAEKEFRYLIFRTPASKAMDVLFEQNAEMTMVEEVAAEVEAVVTFGC